MVPYELGCSAPLTDQVTAANQPRPALDDEYGTAPEPRVGSTLGLVQALAHGDPLGQAVAVYTRTRPDPLTVAFVDLLAQQARVNRARLPAGAPDREAASPTG
ncbi:hypothetical protein ABZW30_34305 [Kitasatospora sp. NPDC004669]|uniref:hypothetical protein n=1 Tax=Kitasatospora sp. NPDC004669 TaxID=3154555 RepID=UPI0033B55A3F